MPTRAWAASPVVASGPPSGTVRTCQGVHPLLSLTRTRTLTSCAPRLLVCAQETPATVKGAVARSDVNTSGSTAAGAPAGALCRAAVSTPLIATLLTLGDTGRAGSEAAKETVGRATKTGVRATARAAEISLIGTVQWQLGWGWGRVGLRPLRGGACHGRKHLNVDGAIHGQTADPPMVTLVTPDTASADPVGAARPLRPYRPFGRGGAAPHREYSAA